MRYLTIKRTKSAVNFFLKIKVYVEDPTSNEIKIQGTRCRKIGEIKNGEQQTFLIGEEKLRIHIVQYKIDKNYGSDFYEIPAGTDSIFLTGKCIYHPVLGDIFRFDGVPTDEMKYRRKLRLKRTLLIAPLFFVVGAVIGLCIHLPLLLQTPAKKVYSENKTYTEYPDKIFTKDNISITLNESFSEDNDPRFYICYVSASDDLFIIINRKSILEFDNYDSFNRMTPSEYCNSFIENNEIDSQVKEKDGLTYFEYERLSDINILWHYAAFMYKTNDGFYFVQFGTYADTHEYYEEDILKYAKSVTFSEASSKPYI